MEEKEECGTVFTQKNELTHEMRKKAFEVCQACAYD